MGSLLQHVSRKAGKKYKTIGAKGGIAPDKIQRFISIKQKLLIVMILLAMVPLFFVSRGIFIGIAQVRDQTQKRIGREFYRNEPVEVIDVRNHEKNVTINETFTQEADWLEGFTIKVKNNSGKAIVYFSWQLEFPETAATGNTMAFPMSYGKHKLRKPELYKEEHPVPPGEIFELTVDDKKYNRLKSFIETRHTLDSLRSVDIRILMIHYDDGTGWSAGTQQKRDPNDPEKWIPADSMKPMEN
ncbi:MAG: hypothetical protein KF855_14430 [Acidobacteria bacterium]|nr:hypothetical protein [Acidobacteriota bacterium]